MHMRQLLISIIILASLPLAGCELFTVHRIDVQQGNALEAEDLAKIKPGMTRDQVRFLLGSPMLTDAFHPGRWDYLYYLDPGMGENETRRLTLFFEGERVARIQSSLAD